VVSSPANEKLAKIKDVVKMKLRIPFLMRMELSFDNQHTTSFQIKYSSKKRSTI